MLSKDIHITDIEPRQYERLAALLASGIGEKSGLIIFYSGNKLTHAVHTKRGPMPDMRFDGPGRLAELAERHEADYVLCMEKNAVRRIAADAQSKIRHDEPLSYQCLALHAALLRETGSGVHFYPDPFAALPEIPPRAMNLIKKIALANTLILAVIFDEDNSIWTSAIVEIKDSEIVFATTTEHLGPFDTAGLSQEETARRLIEALEKKRARPAIGIFLDRDALAHIINHPKPLSAASRLARLGWIQLHPFPARLRLLAKIAAITGK